MLWVVGYISEIWLDAKSCEIERENFADEYVVPASTLKSLWAIILLNELGEDYRIPTIFARYKNTLILRFNGDPTLRFSELDSMLNEEFSRIKSRRVRVIISFPKWGDRYGYGWAWEDIKLGLVSPITPISINYGKVYIDSSLNIFVDEVDEEEVRDTVLYIPKRKYRYKDPLLIIKHIINLAAKRNDKKVRIKVVEKDTINLANYQTDTIYSPRLIDILKPTLYYSINFLADMLVAHYSKGLKNAGNRFVKFMRKLGIEEDAYIFDGSGLSRYNLIKAKDAAFIMCAGSKGLGEYALDIFPSPGEGTLLKRLRDLKEKIHAKTGTLFGVSALLGFYRGCKEEYIFGIFVQNFPLTRKARAEIDNLIRTYGDFLDCARVELK